jgi:CHAD domain-containing protein
VTTIRQFALKQSRALLGELRTHLAQAVSTGEAESIHQTRLAIRRWFAAAAALEDCFDLHEENKIHRTLKKIMQASSSVRDCDVAGKLLHKLQADAGILEQLSHRRVKLARRLTDVLRKASADGIHTRLGRLVRIRPDAGTKPVEEVARRVLEKTLRDFRKRGAVMARRGTAVKKLHRFRIDAKELRYMLELFSGSGAGFDAWIEPVRQVQSLLGDAHDCEAVREMIADWPGRRGVTERLKKRRDEKLRQFRRLWEERFARPLPLPPAPPKPR